MNVNWPGLMSVSARICYGKSRVYCFVATVLMIGIASHETYARPASSLLVVPYHAQERMHYCGPASVQMTIEYISGKLREQNALAVELKTDIVQGITRRSMMSVPFSNRRFSLVYETHAILDDLKEQDSRGYAIILLIWFDTDHKSDHYVVMVGYNETGVIVDDPWPSSWRQPTSRRTGEHSFISSQLLANLWARSDQWALVIPYSLYSPRTAMVLDNLHATALVTAAITCATLAAIIRHRTKTNHHPMTEEQF